jgi:hypothetical protein
VYHSDKTKARRLPIPLADTVRKRPVHTMSRDLHELLYKCYKELGNPDSTLAMHKIYSSHYDSVQSELNHYKVVQEAFRKDVE